MNLCPNCRKPLSENLANCPVCGSKIDAIKTHIDDYRILDYLHDGYGSILYRARRAGDDRDVLIRLFKPESGINAEKADRLKTELDEIRTLPPEKFVRHFEIKKSADGDWYRVSEWIDTLDWGDLIASGFFKDYGQAFSLFAQIASALDQLHAAHRCIPHLILSDILIFRHADGTPAVKIDYKLSRFIDPDLERPSPMLQHLMESHPDIRAGRPFDPKFDVWSLGKIFTELLTGNHDSVDYKKDISGLPLPEKAKTLIREMIEDDPELRPGNMNDIAECLKGITDEDIKQAAASYRRAREAPGRELKRLEKWLLAGAAAIVLLVVGVIFIHMKYGIFSRDDSKILARYAATYENSVVYILTDYWLLVDGEKTCRGLSEGTGFLADKAGYIITNRHVACPWLNNLTFMGQIELLLQNGKTPEFGYRHLLWFNGERAFYRHQSKAKRPEVSDFFHLETAHRSDGSPSVRIAGVISPPHAAVDIIHSPLQEDAAVLKIDDVPENAVPLPLSPVVNAKTITPLSPVMVLGFPRGRKTIRSAEIQVCSTMGHVRRVFENELQMDVSLYPGNSGGPIINTDGRVIGIASAVLKNKSIHDSAIQSDFSLGFPINTPQKLLNDLKAGKVKWDGSIDPLMAHKLEPVMAAAYEGNWTEAGKLADPVAQTSTDPYVLTLSGVMNISAGKRANARKYFEKVVSIEPDSAMALFFLSLLDWYDGRIGHSDYRANLQALDWRSPGEIYGYLFRVLDDQVEEKEALNAWEYRGERALVDFVVALKRHAAADDGRAEVLLRKALIRGDEDTAEYFLIKGDLDALQQSREMKLKGVEREDYIRDKERFNKRYAQLLPKLKKQKIAIKNRFQEILLRNDDDEKRNNLTELLRYDPGNQAILASITFSYLNEGNWEEALRQADAFLSKPGRESANRLGMDLLKGELLYLTGNEKAAEAYLNSFADRISDPWYRDIAQCLVGKTNPSLLEDAASSHPADLLTLHAALGLWSEGAGDKETAIYHYNLAMESFLDNWMEYTLAIERINRLRRKIKPVNG